MIFFMCLKINRIFWKIDSKSLRKNEHNFISFYFIFIILLWCYIFQNPEAILIRRGEPLKENMIIRNVKRNISIICIWNLVLPKIRKFFASCLIFLFEIKRKVYRLFWFVLNEFISYLTLIVIICICKINYFNVKSFVLIHGYAIKTILLQ